MVSVDVKHHIYLLTYWLRSTASSVFPGGARGQATPSFSLPPIPVPNKPSRLCGCKAPCLLTYLLTGGSPRPSRSFRVKARSRVEPLPLSSSPPPPPLVPVPNKPYGFCGRKTPCLYLYLLTYWPRYFRVGRPVQTHPLFPFLSPPLPPPPPRP